MKARIPLSKDQQDEIFRVSRKFIKQGMEEVQTDIDAIWLMAIRDTFGYGEKRLRRLYKRLYALRQEYMNFYMSDGYDGAVSIAARQNLKAIGIDMDELRKDTPYLIDTQFSRTISEDEKRFKERHNVT